jgi:hypothetical protein
VLFKYKRVVVVSALLVLEVKGQVLLVLGQEINDDTSGNCHGDTYKLLPREVNIHGTLLLL